MNTFGFIGHYLGTENFCDLIGWPGSLLRYLPRPFLKDLIRALPPYRFLKMPPFVSESGTTAHGHGFIAPFLPEHLVTWGEQRVLEKVIIAGQFAERLGARIVGLAGFTSVVGNEGEALSKKLNIAVTSGNTLTAALALQGLRKAAALMGVPIRSSTVAIIGATGDIGSICTKILSNEVRRLQLAARNEVKLEAFAATLRQTTGCDVRVLKYVRDAVRDADLILTATSATTTIIEPQDVKPGAIVCDVAVPHNVGTDLLRQRNDVLVFEGGLAKMPVNYLTGNHKWSQISPDGVTIFGCLAETLVLALEGRWENYSIGRGNITPERVQEIEHLADRHGFRLADFHYGGVLFTEDRIRGLVVNAIRANRSRIIEPIVA